MRVAGTGRYPFILPFVTATYQSAGFPRWETKLSRNPFGGSILRSQEKQSGPALKAVANRSFM